MMLHLIYTRICTADLYHNLTKLALLGSLTSGNDAAINQTYKAREVVLQLSSGINDADRLIWKQIYVVVLLYLVFQTVYLPTCLCRSC